MRMKGRISDDKFDKMNKELEKEKFELNIKREELQKADKSAKTNIITAFQLITNAYKLFEGSKIEQKLRLINFIFSNLKLNGEPLARRSQKLKHTLRKPFNLIVNLDSHCNRGGGISL